MNTSATANKSVCPNCGSTEVTYDIENNILNCSFCKSSFNLDEIKGDTNEIVNDIYSIGGLKGVETSEGAVEVNTDTTTPSDTISGICPSCGAKLTISKSENIESTRCHWCKSIVHFDSLLSGGISPDVIIPFKVNKEEAKKLISNEINKRVVYTSFKFYKEFNIENIQPVYLPYIVCDYKFKEHYEGVCGKRTASRKRDKTTYYDFKAYWFDRQYDLLINDLYVEGNSRYIKNEGEDYTKNSLNIINSILPFDLKDAVEYDPKFLTGDFRAEFRDLNTDDINELTKTQTEGISLSSLSKTINEGMNSHGTMVYKANHKLIGAKYVSALCPVWLYSYMDDNYELNYIAVNGQTGEVAACIPVSEFRLKFVSIIIGLAAFSIVPTMILISSS